MSITTTLALQWLLAAPAPTMAWTVTVVTMMVMVMMVIGWGAVPARETEANYDSHRVIR